MTFTNRRVRGTVVNRGRRSYAPGGLSTNNTGNGVRQGFDTLGSGVGLALQYDPAMDLAPGATGVPLVVVEGSVMKFVSALTNIPFQNRPVRLDMVVLTVVSSIPPPDAVRPGVSRGDKSWRIRRSHFSLAPFRNLAPTPSAFTYAQALDTVDRYIETSFPDFINCNLAKGVNNPA